MLDLKNILQKNCFHRMSSNKYNYINIIIIKPIQFYKHSYYLHQNLRKINSFIELNNLNMHTDPNQFKNRKQTKIDEQKAVQLQKRVKQLDTQLLNMQQSFNHSQDSIYYIVSVKFLEQWREFCLSPETNRLMPHSMNFNLYQNNELRKGLVEKADFQFVNEKIYKLFHPFQDNTGLNRRQAVIVGHQKRIPIYLPTFKYILITKDVLKSIDFKKRQIKDFQLSNIKISEESSLKSLLDNIQHQQKILNQYQCRLWLPQKQLTVDKLFSLIRQELKPCRIDQYKVAGAGKRIQDLQAKISQLMLDEDSYFIVQAKTEFQNFAFVRDGQGRCGQCNRFAQLNYPCGCNKIKYCSQKCLQKDKVYHSRHCAFAEQMQLNKKVSMIRSDKNRHGIVGLNNLGNTCFLNSCLQCLSNTLPLTEYFLGQHFQGQINKVNPIGTKGKLAKNYAKFIKAMWCDEQDTYSPYNVKNAVSSINPMFQGYAQHDSQQFFSFLVDGLHEDLNRILKKPIVSSPEQGDKSEAQYARQSWITHLKRNQSIITDTMTGQYRSIVVCPDCHHKSTTFDPFTTISLPIPQSNQTISQFFLIHSNMEKKNKRAWIKYSKKDPQEWNRKACDAVGMDVAKCNLYVVSLKQNIYKVGRQSMAEIVHKIQNQNKNMFLMEFSEEQLSIPKQNLVQFTLRISKHSYGDSQQVFFKIPVLFDKKTVTGIQVYKKVLKFLYSQAYDNSKNRKTFGWGGKSYEQYQKQLLAQRPLKIILRTGKKIQRAYQRVEVQFKKQEQIKDETNLIEYLEKQGLKTTDCQIDARFQKNKSSQFTFSKLKDFDTVGRQPKSDKSQTQVQLSECLQTFKTPQILESGNQWYCPKCKQHKLAKKQLGIYRAPKILILHLKRFKQKGTYRKQKNQTLVKFPAQLDMNPYLINQKPIQAYKQQIIQQVYEHPKSQSLNLVRFNTKSKPIYDLYAISNHYGGLGGGHYTAYAKNNGEWYSFDDSHVSKAGRKQIVSSSAYLLFYERRQ